MSAIEISKMSIKPKFRFTKRIFVIAALALAGGAYIAHEQSVTENISTVIPSIERYIIQNENNQYLYGQPVSWNHAVIPVSALGKLDSTRMSLKERNALVSYLIHRIPFAEPLELKVISSLVAKMDVEGIEQSNSAYLSCLVDTHCETITLAERFPNSKWVPHWYLRSDLDNLTELQPTLNALDSSSLSRIQYFDHAPVHSNDMVTVPPALADALVTIPFIENCAYKSQELIMYLFEVKEKYPPMTELAEHYMDAALTGTGECY